jgi:hypothetical protein
MSQIIPKSATCNRCNLTIKETDSFVRCRFGQEFRFWHNRSRDIEDCWGKFVLDRGHNVLGGDIQTMQATKPSQSSRKRSPRAPATPANPATP